MSLVQSRLQPESHALLSVRNWWNYTCWLSTPASGAAWEQARELQHRTHLDGVALLGGRGRDIWRRSVVLVLRGRRRRRLELYAAPFHDEVRGEWVSGWQGGLLIVRQLQLLLTHRVDLSATHVVTQRRSQQIDDYNDLAVKCGVYQHSNFVGESV